MTRSNRSIGLVIAILAVVLIGLFVFRGYLGSPIGIPNTGVIPGQNGGVQGQLGQAFVASAVDQSGCPANQTTQFSSTQAIYTGFTTSSVPQGTSMFARLSRGGQTLEDARVITASQDMRSCIWFVFKPSQSSAGFQPGNYQVSLFVNGNQVQTLQFSVGQAGSANSGSQKNGLQLSQLIVTDHVDSSGCPGDNIAAFRSDQPVYVAYDRSFVPSGTQLFARLIQNGETLEDTKQINADQDMSSCIWFVFKSQSQGGLQPGNYIAQIFVNGNQADAAHFTVR